MYNDNTTPVVAPMTTEIGGRLNASNKASQVVNHPTVPKLRSSLARSRGSHSQMNTLFALNSPYFSVIDTVTGISTHTL